MDLLLWAQVAQAHKGTAVSNITTARAFPYDLLSQSEAGSVQREYSCCTVSSIWHKEERQRKSRQRDSHPAMAGKRPYRRGGGEGKWCRGRRRHVAHTVPFSGQLGEHYVLPQFVSPARKTNARQFLRSIRAQAGSIDCLNRPAPT